MARLGRVVLVVGVVLALLAPSAVAASGPPLGYARHWTTLLARQRCEAKGECQKVEVRPCLDYKGAAECVALIEWDGGYCTFRTKTLSVNGVLRRYSSKPICG